jgi:hypothetical protein
VPPKKAIPIKRDQGAAALRQNALTRLRERFEIANEGEEWEPETEPIVTPLLKRVDGGIPYVLEALRSHDDDDARDFLDLYDSLTAKDRKYLSLEEIAHASGIGSLRLTEITNTAIILHSKMAVSMMLASHMPKVVATNLKQAATPKGLADREWALKAGGYLPVPKGATIAIQNNLNEGKGEAKEIEEAPRYKDAGERLREIHDAVESRRLPSPASEPFLVGGRLSSMQDSVAEILVERGEG